MKLLSSLQFTMLCYLFLLWVFIFHASFLWESQQFHLLYLSDSRGPVLVLMSLIFALKML